MKVLFYGNCQAGAIQKILSLDDSEYISCHKTNYDKTTFTNKLKEFDVIIAQPTSENYRNKDYLSTRYIVDNRKKGCQIILFDSCYFNFYYFDLA